MRKIINYVFIIILIYNCNSKSEKNNVKNLEKKVKDTLFFGGSSYKDLNKLEEFKDFEFHSSELLESSNKEERSLTCINKRNSFILCLEKVINENNTVSFVPLDTVKAEFSFNYDYVNLLQCESVIEAKKDYIIYSLITETDDSLVILKSWEIDLLLDKFKPINPNEIRCIPIDHTLIDN